MFFQNVVMPIIYIVLSVVGMIGNGCVIYIFARRTGSVEQGNGISEINFPKQAVIKNILYFKLGNSS